MIYTYYIKHIDKLSEEFINVANQDGEERAVCDYVAGMSDNYALKVFNNIYVPTFWIE
jgi:dGTPase